MASTHARSTELVFGAYTRGVPPRLRAASPRAQNTELRGSVASLGVIRRIRVAVAVSVTPVDTVVRPRPALCTHLHPPARYRSSTLRVCWACFVVLEPDKAKLKIRSEHYIVDELTRRMPGLMTRARSATWDCTAPGGCSLKRADLLYILDDRYIQIEVDERGHAGYDCYDEDTRLEIIAADVGLPGVVLRLNPDAPPCFRPKRLSNGEIAVQISNRAALDSLMTQACEAIATYLDNPPPPTLVRLYLPRVS